MLKRLLSIFLLWATVALIADGAPFQPDPAVSTDDEDEIEEVEENGDEVDEDDRYARENPVIEYDDEIDIPIPGFIKVGKNRIQLNGADWSRLISAINSSDRKAVSIVHIGDSHVQADIGTGTTRDLLQFDYGDAGRGIITPLRMSGTNEPRDYIFTSPNSWNAVKLMKMPWSRTMGFTGTSISPTSTNSSFTVGTSTRDDYDPFSSFLIFHKGKFTVEKVTDENGAEIPFRAIPSRDYTQVILGRPEVRVTVDFSSEGDLTLFGVSLSGDRPGVFYHAIGNNGATYDTYNRIGSVGQGISPLKPELVIISLGCNEAFGRLDTQGFYHSIDKLVKNIRKANPDAQLLLVTPMECQKSVYTTTTKVVKVPAHSSGKGKKKGNRRKTGRMVNKTIKTKVKSYAVNNNIAPLRNEILRYGRDNNIAVYDWYDIAGGDGASSTWIHNGYFSGDRVHHSAKGYHLQGRLLYEALIDEFGRQ